MHERTHNPAEHRPEGRDDNIGNTTPAQGETQTRTPREPHERDESADSQAAQEPSMRRMGQIAHDSVQRGETDTTKGEATDDAYEKTMQGTPRTEKQFRR